MRLIDADAFKKQIAGMTIANNYPVNKASALCDLIDAQPTAYDVNAVLKKLEKNGQKMSEANSNKLYGKSTPGCHNYYKAISVKRAIEIVKGGEADAKMECKCRITTYD